jgi:hypothetical protein
MAAIEASKGTVAVRLERVLRVGGIGNTPIEGIHVESGGDERFDEAVPRP